jgi:hypothetical protein
MSKNASTKNPVSYKDTKQISCGSCDGIATVTGVFATGLPIKDPYMDYTYNPTKDELLKIKHLRCGECGFEQWS